MDKKKLTLVATLFAGVSLAGGLRGRGIAKELARRE
jgi:hypothetical protein